MMGPALMLFASGGEASSGDSESVVHSAPRSLTVYDYAAGAKYGLQWVNGESNVPTQVYRDDVLFGTVSAGLNTRDIGVKAGDGAHTWKVRHAQGNEVSNFSSSISTSNGIVT